MFVKRDAARVQPNISDHPITDNGKVQIIVRKNIATRWCDVNMLWTLRSRTIFVGLYCPFVVFTTQISVFVRFHCRIIQDVVCPREPCVRQPKKRPKNNKISSVHHAKTAQKFYVFGGHKKSYKHHLTCGALM